MTKKQTNKKKQSKNLGTEATQEIKNLIMKHRLFRYEVAEAMGISEGYLSTLLRKPLTEEMEQKVREAKESKMSLVMELIEYSLASKWQSPVIQFQI